MVWFVYLEGWVEIIVGGGTTSHSQTTFSSSVSFSALKRAGNFKKNEF